MLGLAVPAGASGGVWKYGVYADVGYGADFNDPGNGIWRTKSTTFEVNDPRVNMAMAYVHRDATSETRWGVELGVQGGVDTKGLVPEPPPASNDPVSNADFFRHLSVANASYLFNVGRGLTVTGGLFGAYIGYEPYHAMGNSNYTRGYISDYVPYFLTGIQASYPFTDAISLTFLAVTGFNYLANPNDVPSYGFQFKWGASSEISFTQNLYYGPDQNSTDVRYWRFFSDSILEWNRGPFLVAAAFDAGTEKRDDVTGHPTHSWMAGAVWARWGFSGPWSVAFRPEFYWDPDGVSTGAKQTIQAYTTTLEYRFSPLADNTLVASLEYRYDRSTGEEGGFYHGGDNALVPDRDLLLLALTWKFANE
jgi:hypothetical protein